MIAHLIRHFLRTIHHKKVGFKTQRERDEKIIVRPFVNVTFSCCYFFFHKINAGITVNNNAMIWSLYQVRYKLRLLFQSFKYLSCFIIRFTRPNFSERSAWNVLFNFICKTHLTKNVASNFFFPSAEIHRNDKTCRRNADFSVAHQPLGEKYAIALSKRLLTWGKWVNGLLSASTVRSLFRFNLLRLFLFQTGQGADGTMLGCRPQSASVVLLSHWKV